MAPLPVVLFTLLIFSPSTTCFLVPRNTVSQPSLTSSIPSSPTTTIGSSNVVPVSKLHANQRKNDDNDEDDRQSPSEDLNPLAKASWYAVETFGKLFGSSNNDKDDTTATTRSNVKVDLSRAPSSVQETIQRIQLDNDRYYFLSGKVDRLCYAEDCIFSDPFVSFEGRDRFVDNLQNLGSFVTEYDVKQLGYDVVLDGDGDQDAEDDGTRVDTKVMVKLELNLPWKPILAWPWGVRYDIDPETFLINNHKESWDIDPWEVCTYTNVYMCVACFRSRRLLLNYLYLLLLSVLSFVSSHIII